jgi:hypothetical protein
MRNMRSLGQGLLKSIRLFPIFLGTLFLAASGYGDAPPFSEVTDALFGNVPLSTLTDSEQNVVFEDPGTIIVFHGGGCAKSDRAGKQQVLKIEQSVDVPSYAKTATVFLDGWRLQYLHGDHHVGFVVTAIRNTRLERQTLKWEAIGKLADRNFDDAYLWCYRFTAFGWDPSQINVSVNDKDDPLETDNITFQNFFAGQNLTDSAPPDSAGVVFPRFVAAGQQRVAILPRGFVFGWNDDHHLLQIAYNLNHSERFIDASRKYFNRGKNQLPQLATSQVSSEFTSWETTVIFKDNDGHRDYAFGEVVSVLRGDDVGLIQPPFSSQVVRPECCADASGGGVRTESFVIENIPFQYAIPVLTGWEVHYDFARDQHVREMGVWIDEVRYERNPQTQLGRLQYKLSSVLQDKDGRPAFFSRHRVTVVGLRPIGGGRPIPLTK